jgi:ABC-2 type transport system permease protein
MRLSQAWWIARHDIGLFRRRKGILYGLVAFPLGVAIGFPALIWYIIAQNASSPLGSYLPTLIDAFGFWFVIGAVSLPTTIASYGIVGERTEKSLEPLLATPTTDEEILFGKVLAAFVPTVLALWAGSVLFMGLTDWVSHAALGYLFYPNWGFAFSILVLMPLACICAIEASVVVSSRVTDVRSAQQYSGLIFVPFIFLYIFGEIGTFPLDLAHTVYLAGALAVMSALLFFVSTRTFQREEILTRWK